MQRAAHLAGPLPLLARRLPVPLQRSPHPLPVLRGRFHDYFLDLLLVQPLGQQVQLTGSSAELSALKLILAFPSDVSHHYRQHLLLVNVNCCDSIRHHASPWRSGEHAKGNPRQGHVAIAAPEGDERRPIIRAERACSGSNRGTASTSPL